jgi:ubiquinone/menaquinone biosynthesis C-methylase UbiE
MAFASIERTRSRSARVLDIGCGAARNAVPLADLGWSVLGVDLSAPMLAAALARARAANLERSCRFVVARMDRLPVAAGSCDLLVAHGIWNLARSDDEFRAGVREAARVAKPGGALFVFTFSRSTLDDSAQPISSESFVFTQFSNNPHAFLTRDQLLDELSAVGFAPDPDVPLRELNRRTPGMLAAAGAPVIWEGAFRLAAPPPT